MNELLQSKKIDSTSSGIPTMQWIQTLGVYPCSFSCSPEMEGSVSCSFSEKRMDFSLCLFSLNYAKVFSSVSRVCHSDLMNSETLD